MKRLLIFIVLLLSACSRAHYTSISMDEAVKQMQERTDYVLLDVRSEEEFQAGHIPHAICIPHDTIGDQRLPPLGDLDQLIYVYCRSGNRSKVAAERLVKLGYTQVIECGGINSYHGELAYD